MSDWKARLLLSRKEFEEGLRSEGREAGEKWAEDFSEFADLLALKQLSEESGEEVYAHDVVNVLNADWEAIIPDGTLEPDVFAAAFVEGALGRLSEVS